MHSKKGISVILPVFKDVAVTRSCINSCLPSILSEGGRLVLINDASPEPGMGEMLDQIARQYPQTILVITNTCNLGFTSSVNLGLKAVRGDDVVLLNSDVLTPRKWLSILRSEAKKNRNIGTVTPLSNNSTITSLPIRNQGSDQWLKHPVEIINDSFSNELPLVTAPTGIGFCMYISAECLARVGSLDAKSFGKGYGEENDFCQRALKAGFLNTLTPNLYCHHIGSVSFGRSARSRMEVAYHTIDKLHPNYHADVATWVARDPLGPARILRNLQVFRELGLPIVLHITHSIGGEPSRYVNMLTSETAENAFHVVLQGRRNEKDALLISLGSFEQSSIQRVSLVNDRDALTLLNSIDFTCIHIHHLAGVPQSIIQWATSATGTPYILSFYDYYLVNGNPFLCDNGGKYIGLEAAPQTSPFSKICSHPYSFGNWRAESQALIERSICNIFPCHDTYSRFSQAFTQIPNAKIVPHDNFCQSNTSDSIHDRCVSNNIKSRGTFRIGVLGILSIEKGADFLEKIAQEASSLAAMTQFKFTVIGFAYRRLHGVDQTGPYRHEELQDIIKSNQLDCIFFPSRYPETYSDTLSEAICSGLPIVAPMLGAFKERLDNHPCRLLYNINSPHNIIAQEIIDFSIRSFRVPAHNASLKINGFYKLDYIEMLSSLKRSPRTLRPSVIYSVITKSLLGPQESHHARRRILGVAIKIYRQPVLGLLLRLVPFSLARQAKEWIYPWPIKISSRDSATKVSGPI